MQSLLQKPSVRQRRIKVHASRVQNVFYMKYMISRLTEGGRGCTGCTCIAELAKSLEVGIPTFHPSGGRPMTKQTNSNTNEKASGPLLVCPHFPSFGKSSDEIKYYYLLESISALVSVGHWVQLHPQIFRKTDFAPTDFKEI